LKDPAILRMRLGSDGLLLDAMIEERKSHDIALPTVNSSVSAESVRLSYTVYILGEAI
jgi:hypothetical protein